MTDHAQRSPLATRPTQDVGSGQTLNRDDLVRSHRAGRGAKIALRVVAVALGLLLPLLLLEGALRLFGPFLPGNYDTGSMVRRDPVLGHFHPAGTRTWVRSP